MNGANIFAQLKFAKSRGQLLPKYITIITHTYCVSGVCNVEGDVVPYFIIINVSLSCVRYISSIYIHKSGTNV